jgi:ABC-type uncharacterized transport system auxiliary subunit
MAAAVMRLQAAMAVEGATISNPHAHTILRHHTQMSRTTAAATIATRQQSAEIATVRVSRWSRSPRMDSNLLVQAETQMRF